MEKILGTETSGKSEFMTLFWGNSCGLEWTAKLLHVSSGFLQVFLPFKYWSRDVFRAFVGIIHDRIMIVYIIFASFIILRVGFSYLHSEAYNLPVVELG